MFLALSSRRLPSAAVDLEQRAGAAESPVLDGVVQPPDLEVLQLVPAFSMAYGCILSFKVYCFIDLFYVFYVFFCSFS